MSGNQEMDDILNIPESYQKYVDEIYKLSHNKHGGWVTNKDLAENLKVERPSITGMLHKLNKAGLINWTPRKAIRLTKKGRNLADRLSTTHSLLKRFFHELLEINDEELIERISCEIEHHIPMKVQKSLADFIDYYIELKECNE
jgi:DtxR family Mn-dependent transcriptional regulator